MARKKLSTKKDREAWEAYKQTKQYHIDKAKQQEEDLESSFEDDEDECPPE